MSIMGIDVGTTGCKVVAFSAGGTVLARAYAEYPLLTSQEGWAELDPNEVWSNLCDTIRQVNAQVGGDPVEALAVSAQGEAVIAVAENGEVLDRSPVSFDVRARAQAARLRDEMGEEQVYHLSGQPIHPMYSLLKIVWWQQQRPEVFARTWRFLCYGDFVAFKLGVTPTIDYTMAARMLAFNIRTYEWSPELLAWAGLSADRLPALAPSGTPIGEISIPIAQELGFQRPVTVVTGGHDQPCGALGAGVLETGEAMYAIGTTECIAPIFATPKATLWGDRFPCYPHVLADRYITLAGNFTGGALLRWYRDQLGAAERAVAAETGQDVYDVMIAQVSERPSHLFVLPHFAGTGSPFHDPDAKGAIFGLTFDTRREDIVKALLEGITFELALNLQHLRRAGIEIDLLRAIGGGARSTTWMQMKADIMGIPVIVPQVADATCLGAALLAGLGKGIYTSADEAVGATVREAKRYVPDEHRAAFYAERLRVYEQLYPAVSAISPYM
ncbi:MAG: hypothetical protein H3C34_07155 [Caldilineaceae bacterium]|nr:hypothetical protein [Caldilineaceae bacterium]